MAVLLTRNQLLDILERRFGNATLRSAIANEASQEANVKSLKTMTAISVSGEMERELEQRTATNVRALTVVATLYLPASLLAVRPLVLRQTGWNELTRV